MFNSKQLKELKKAGTIRGFQVTERKKGFSSGKKVVRGNKALSWLGWNLMFWAKEHGFKMEWEKKFSDRGFRFDFSLVRDELKLGIEYEGGLFMQRGGHNSPKGITRDIEKYALAEKLGWRVIRLHALNYTTVLKTLNEML